jgi:hypothetical protein
MTTSLKSRIHAELAWTWQDRLGDSPIIFSNRLQCAKDLADGFGDNQADAVWYAKDQTIMAGQSTTYDLDMLEQTMFGDTITIPFVRIKGLLIVNQNTVGNGYLLIGGAASNEWNKPFGASGDTLAVMPASPLLLANVRDGWDVTFAARSLKVAAVGGDVTFDISAIGTLSGGSGGSSSSSSYSKVEPV